MADNDNTITLVGRIGQEPELRATSKGDVLNFTLATSERRRGVDNSWSDGPTSWFRVSAWNDLARHGHASLHRGQQVIVRGVLTVREFQLEGGGKSKAAELRATALGHDLRWGTTTYQDGARPAATQQALPAAETPSASPEASQSERVLGWGAPSAAEQQRETVPAGPPVDRSGEWASSLGSDDVPF